MGKKKKMGAPEKLSEEKFLEKMKEKGVRMTFDTIMGFPFIREYMVADFFGCSEDTICRYAKKEFGLTFAEMRKQKAALLKVRLALKQIDVALQGHPSMLIWCGKHYLDQNDKMEMLHESKIIIEKEDVDL